ncbi:EF-hand domain-containing protein, partial [Nostoc sp. HG1]|nr:EF-hand domain-containing protein [Nostoc sp. HG1]
SAAPQELLSRYASNEDGSITFEELKQAVKNANNLT